MDVPNSILIVDDEAAFRQFTAELLRRDGYDCECASDADGAIEMLKTNRYDVLISDIKMPGNANLRFVREAQRLAPGTPVILVTGYPSADSAISAIELPVVAYLKKPVDYAELLKHVQTSIKRLQSSRTVSHVRHLLQKCVHDLEDVERSEPLPNGKTAGTRAAIPAVTVRTLTACLSELLKLYPGATSGETTAMLCELIACPQWPVHRDAFLNAIAVLKETRRRFKSKELADLRTRLESALENPRGAADNT